MGLVGKERYAEAIILTGDYGAYKGKPLGEILFEEFMEKKDGKIYVEYKWTWTGAPGGGDKGDFQWSRVVIPHPDEEKSYLQAVILLDSEFYSGEVHHLRWREKIPPDRPWFKSESHIGGEINNKKTEEIISFKASPKP